MRTGTQPPRRQKNTGECEGLQRDDLATVVSIEDRRSTLSNIVAPGTVAIVITAISPACVAWRDTRDRRNVAPPSDVYRKTIAFHLDASTN
ncbi:hypothetical protein CBM2595_A80083 [Cupriavidus taiwanensis]|nr:hypothetical protein CBM2595_A80083 [Cupriavidus taiwanensis]